jgi:hypothetical protein
LIVTGPLVVPHLVELRPVPIGVVTEAVNVYVTDGLKPENGAVNGALPGLVKVAPGPEILTVDEVIVLPPVNVGIVIGIHAVVQVVVMAPITGASAIVCIVIAALQLTVFEDPNSLFAKT